ncbi:hypothetical protein ES705_26524 [subsurface metagenome]|jgi:hypothetical protein|nr:MAG: hypothetical protein ES695_00795 [Candidatus Atribacteria bacterium 1244-E10-H5-B2]
MDKKIKAFTSSYKKISRVLSNEVIITKAVSPSNSKRLYLKDYDHKKYNSIWDTGATGSVITKKVAQEFDLKPAGMVEVHTASDTKMANTYLVNIWLPGKVVFYNLIVTEGKLTGQCEVLIGMDIISEGDFAVTNYNGRTVFTFRIPSVGCIDFVKNPYQGKNVSHCEKK